MKHFNKLFAAVLMLVGLSSQAQDSNNPWAVSFGVNAIDGGRVSAAGPIADQFSQYFDLNAYWSILPSVSYVNVARSVGDNFSVGLTGSINKIDVFVSPRPTIPGDYVVTNPGDLSYYAADLALKYSFMSLMGSKVFDPYIHAGGGYTWLGTGNSGTANGGLGINFWLTENVGLNLQSTYKYAFEDDRTDMPTHMQHFAGLIFKFGAKDTDGDKIPDYKDACPEVFGLKEYNGCPDTDGDGIIDGSDACPTVFGLTEYNGCPDTDGDTIIDEKDACPDTFGLVALNGCPDQDGDGVADKDDKCPTVAGPKDNGGCPQLDADKDGVPDLQDDCPTVAGPISNKGCPEVTVEVIEKLKIQARSVFFNSGKATFKAGDAATITSLDAMREILKNYPNAKFSIDGHTDSDGSDKFNQKLSEDRANAVRNALIEKGIKPENLTAVGYGESKPIGTNKTKEGKALNRRTEVRHVGSIYEGKL